MSRLDLPFYATLSLCAGPWLFARGFSVLRTRRLIQNTPTARIRSMAMGLVEINGTVGARSALAAPLSGRACAYWEVDISTRARSRNWIIVHRNSSGQPFYLSDETGRALIYPKGSQCKVRFGHEDECLGLKLPEVYAQYMSDQRLAMRHFWRLSVMRFRERILEEGQNVYVLGTAMPRLQVLSVADSDLEATGTFGAPARPARVIRDEGVAVIRRGENDSTFIISQESERELTLGLGFQGFSQLLGGPAMTLFGLGYWLYALSTGSVFK